MDEARFREAEEAYRAGDFRAAAKGFLSAAGSGSGSGVAYHKAGNSLMRLRRYSDAVNVYVHALQDEAFTDRAAVLTNLGAAQAAQGHYAEAIEAYSEATDDETYECPYKALQGLAGALYEAGRTEEAAAAYRRAALDGSNPDPGKALNNLGLCYVTLGRPEDAIEAYKAALTMEVYTGKGKAAANLGIAYAALGRDEDALKAFEKSTQLYSHDLSVEARGVYEAVVARVAERREVVEGWSTGEMPPVPLEELQAQDGPAGPEAETTEPEVGEADSAFFTRSEEDMRDIDREARRQARAGRRVERSTLLIIGGWIAAAAVLVTALAVAYFMGFGWPTQASTVNGMIRSRAEGADVERFWVAVPPQDVEKEMGKLPVEYKKFALREIERSPSTSKVSVVFTLEKDDVELHYEITMAREGVGWKVTGVENDWRSTGGGT